MKIMLIFLIVLLCSTQLSAQTKTGYSDDDYLLVKNFLQWEKNNPSWFPSTFHTQWNNFSKRQRQWRRISNKTSDAQSLAFRNAFLPPFSLTGFDARDYKVSENNDEGPGLLSIIAGAAFGIFVQSKYNVNGSVINFNRKFSAYDNNNNKTLYQELPKNY